MKLVLLKSIRNLLNSATGPDEISYANYSGIVARNIGQNNLSDF